MSAHTRAQLTALGALRFLLRHARTELNTTRGGGGARDASEFSSFILARFREGARVKERAAVKALRAEAADVTAYLRAVAEQRVRFGRARARAAAHWNGHA